MGNMKAVVPIAVSLVIAIAGSFFIYQWIQKQTVPTEVVRVESEAVPVLVAKTDISWGTKLTRDMVTTAPFFKESLPPGYHTNFTDIQDRVVIVPVKAGEPVSEHRLASTDIKTGGVSAVLKPGRRAIAVKGDKIIGISGFIKPGDRVDVLVTVNDRTSDIEKTKIVLQNVLVLATGTMIEEDAQGKPLPVDVYTLDVTPEESEKLALVATEGKIQLALRGLIDSEQVTTAGATIASTLAGMNPVPAVQSSPANPQPARQAVRRAVVPRNSHTVEIIKGTDMSSQKFDM
jgi:pilus assembly protein CpaB